MQSYYSCQSGRSMVEILGVLAVIGVLSVGGIAAYSKAMEKINTDQLIVDISTTARKIKNLYADQKSYEDLDQQVYTLNLVAGAHKIEGMNKKLLHIFNGEVFVKSIALNKGFVMARKEGKLPGKSVRHAGIYRLGQRFDRIEISGRQPDRHHSAAGLSFQS